MSEYLKIENHPDLVKDTRSGAVITTDTAAFEAYINRRKIQENSNQRLDRLESDVSEIKNLLQEMLNRLG